MCFVKRDLAGARRSAAKDHDSASIFLSESRRSCTAPMHPDGLWSLKGVAQYAEVSCGYMLHDILEEASVDSASAVELWLTADGWPYSDLHEGAAALAAH